MFPTPSNKFMVLYAGIPKKSNVLPIKWSSAMRCSPRIRHIPPLNQSTDPQPVLSSQNERSQTQHGRLPAKLQHLLNFCGAGSKGTLLYVTSLGVTHSFGVLIFYGGQWRSFVEIISCKCQLILLVAQCEFIHNMLHATCYWKTPQTAKSIESESQKMALQEIARQAASHFRSPRHPSPCMWDASSTNPPGPSFAHRLSPPRDDDEKELLKNIFCWMWRCIQVMFEICLGTNQRISKVHAASSCISS